MEEKKIEGYTPEEVEAIRKKDRFYNKARRAVSVSIASFFGAALILLAGTMITGITSGVLTDKQTALIDELCNSSSEYNELYTKQVNGLRSDLVNNKITDKEYMESIDKLNSKEHKREVLTTLSDIDLTDFNQKEERFSKWDKALNITGKIALSCASINIPLCCIGDYIKRKDSQHYEKYEDVLCEDYSLGD